MDTNPEIGRTLRANIMGFSFGTRSQQLSIPQFGGLVKAQTSEDECIYGLIYDINVDDDPLVGRLVLSDNLSPTDIEDQRNNRLLPIEMSVLSVGHRANDKITYGFPPRPPLNLDAVYMVTSIEELKQFTDRFSYLRLVLRAEQNGVPVDQLLVAHIRSIYHLRGQDNVWAHGVIQEVIELLRSNYETLIPTLEALSDALPVLGLSAETKL